MIGHFKPNDIENIKNQLVELNHNLVFCSEHTWGAYDSIARPYSERTQGNHNQKFDYFFRCDEDSKRIQADIIRNSKLYKPLSQTSYIEVINPGRLPRSGWVDISAIALRREANGIRNVRTKEFFPFEKIPVSDWVPKDEGIKIPADEIPNDVWPYRHAINRLHLSNFQPGEKRKFELVHVGNIPKRLVSTSKFYQPEFDHTTGLIKNIKYVPKQKMLFDANVAVAPMQLVIERPKGEYIRDDINSLKADPQKFHYSNPVIKNVKWKEGIYSICLTAEFEEPFAKKIIQQIHFFDSIRKIEITTTIWQKENLDPIAVYLAFPFSTNNPSAYYDSFGSPVEVGKDQLANTCGIYNTVQNGVIFKGDDFNIALTTQDAPIGIFEKLERFRRRPVFKPQTAHFYSLLCENYWITNFAALKPAKCIFRHIIECGDEHSQPTLVENDELWAYPVS
jgi:hypothetical protein